MGFLSNIRVDHLRFGFYLKTNKTKFKKKNQNRIKTGSNWPVSVQFGYFKTKTETQPIGFGSVRFWFDSVRLFYIKNKKICCFWGFFVMSLVSVWLCFFFCLARLLISVRFDFSVSSLWNQNWTEPVSFFKYSNQFNRFFFTVRFFQLLFSGFLDLIGFSVFLLIPTKYGLTKKKNFACCIYLNPYKNCILYIKRRKKRFSIVFLEHSLRILPIFQ